MASPPWLKLKQDYILAEDGFPVNRKGAGDCDKTGIFSGYPSKIVVQAGTGNFLRTGRGSERQELKTMTGKRDNMAAAVGRKPEVVELLDRNLGPGDQAWVVCDFDDCIHSTQRRCTIFMVHNVPKMVPGKPCNAYRKRP